eukprot:NODE_1609_length_1357_cov_31.522936_g1333_i0.p1 GENE.NODE_1609_length_1357_cov_31.522936_g1333_i0~~NODE_1609_length_1357_cov_31.522936_g1333_i0.p1  ORF type:complete len:371 (+),score=129.53 NODE_1609_length_1357_cov_31.522936_g1333_i0:171-1283(+)
MSVLDKIADIEKEMARTQKNKATMGHLGLLKAKLAKLKRELIEGPPGSGGGGAKQPGFDVHKTGDARVGLIGFPSVGKSTLLNKLTSTFSEVASYEFTTLTCVPGIIKYKGAKIQLLDLPGIIEGAKDGKGRGRQVIAVARTCHMIIIVLDVTKPVTHKRIIEKELEGFGIRLNQKPPEITLKKKEKGGINISSTCPLTHLDHDTIRSILSEFRIISADINFKLDATEDQLIDVLEGGRHYVPCVYALNKMDAITIEELDIIARVPHNVPISANDEWNLDGLLDAMWEHLGLIRIYTKPRGQIPDYAEPVILRTGADPSVATFCNKLHKQMLANFKYAWVWGMSVKHNPQKVGKDHVICDEDIIQIVKKV